MARRPKPTAIDELSTLRAGGLSDEDIADVAGVDPRTVRRWAGSANAPAKVREKLRKVAVAVKQPLHFGVCCDFLDTSLPVLVELTSAPREMGLPPISFVPIPWNEHCLDGLQHGVLDYVIFNEELARLYSTDTGAKFDVAPGGDKMRSGSFYIAVRGPGAKQVNVSDVEVLKNLFSSPDTVYLVPPADMLAALSEVRNNLVPDLAAQPLRSLEPPPGYGLSLFINQPQAFSSVNLVYVGGQDQRAELEEQKVKDKSFRLITSEQLGNFAPRVLWSRNVLLSRKDPRVPLESIVELLEQTRTEVRNRSRLDEDPKVVLARWHWLANTRHSRSESMMRKPIQEICAMFNKIIPLSPMAAEWLGEVAS